MKDEVFLKVPARQPMMLVVRMAMAGFFAQCGADVDTLEDVRTACDEACYCLMHQRRSAETISLRAGFDGEYASVVFEAERGEAAQEYAAHDPEIARGILSMLANDVRIDHDSDGPRRIDLRLCPAIPAGGGNER